MEEELTIEQTIDWAQDPIRTCAESPVILEANFDTLAEDLADFTDQVSMPVDDIKAMFREQSKRFVGCGGNFGADDRSALIRRNPDNGWKYILDIIA